MPRKIDTNLRNMPDRKTMIFQGRLKNTLCIRGDHEVDIRAALHPDGVVVQKAVYAAPVKFRGNMQYPQLNTYVQLSRP